MSDDRQDYFAPDSLHGREVFFHNVRAGTVLDLSSGSSTYGTKCQGWSFNGSNAQKWRLEKVNLEQAQSPWTIRNVESGTFMDLNGGSSDDGTQIHGWHRNDGRNVASEWFLITQEENNPSIFMIQNLHTSTYVDLDGGRNDNGTKLQGWHRENNNPNQQWRISFD